MDLLLIEFIFETWFNKQYILSHVEQLWTNKKFWAILITVRGSSRRIKNDAFWWRQCDVTVVTVVTGKYQITWFVTSLLFSLLGCKRTFLETKFLITMTSVMLREVGTKFVTFHQVWESFVAEALKVCNFGESKIFRKWFHWPKFILVEKNKTESDPWDKVIQLHSHRGKVSG